VGILPDGKIIRVKILYMKETLKGPVMVASIIPIYIFVLLLFGRDKQIEIEIFEDIVSIF